MTQLSIEYLHNHQDYVLILLLVPKFLPRFEIIRLKRSKTLLNVNFATISFYVNFIVMKPNQASAKLGAILYNGSWANDL